MSNDGLVNGFRVLQVHAHKALLFGTVREIDE
jgi:hypothetical protein